MVGHRGKMRLDELVVARSLAEDADFARRLIMAGEVYVDEQLVTQPGTRVPAGADIRLKTRARFVSRGGDKLAAALVAYDIDLAGRVCADVGASTGGFTDAMLQAGAARVYAVDVGYGQLAWELRQDERVVVMDRTNARHLDELPEPVSFVSIDVSFISLRHILPQVRGWLSPGGEVVALVKPQFEAARDDVGEGGVVRDPSVHRRVLEGVVEHAAAAGLVVRGLMPSPVQGPAGNVEFLLWADTGSVMADVNRAALIDAALAEA